MVPLGGTCGSPSSSATYFFFTFLSAKSCCMRVYASMLFATTISPLVAMSKRCTTIGSTLLGRRCCISVSTDLRSVRPGTLSIPLGLFTTHSHSSSYTVVSWPSSSCCRGLGSTCSPCII